jgi:hypothetical protein
VLPTITLENLESINFNIFQLETDYGKEHTLQLIASNVFTHWDFATDLDIDFEMFQAYVK